MMQEMEHQLTYFLNVFLSYDKMSLHTDFFEILDYMYLSGRHFKIVILAAVLHFSPTGEGLPKFVAIVSKLHMLYNQNLCIEKVRAISYIIIYTCHRNCSPF